MIGWDLASKVTIDKAYDNDDKNVNFVEFSSLADFEPCPFHVVAYDFGIKSHILRNLTRCGAKVTVVPSSTPAEDVLRLKPDGIFLSNGPGILSRSNMQSRMSGNCWVRNQSSGSVSVTRSWDWLWAERPTS